MPQDGEPEETDPPTPPSSRSKTVKVVGGIAGAVIVGVLVLSALPGNGEESQKAPTSVSADQGADLPAADGGIPQGDLPAAGSGPTTGQRNERAGVNQPSARGVKLEAHSSGKGRVGAIVDVTIRNDTDEPLTVLSSLMKGDGRSAVVGEGTLAPGSRVIQPGEAAEGTVEFASEKAPHQVALLDLSGNLIAASN